PVSREMRSRRGPRHRGQSSARAHGPGHATRNASAAQASPIPLLNGNDMAYLLLRTARRGAAVLVYSVLRRGTTPTGKATQLFLHRRERLGTLTHLFSQSSPRRAVRRPRRRRDTRSRPGKRPIAPGRDHGKVLRLGLTPERADQSLPDRQSQESKVATCSSSLLSRW